MSDKKITRRRVVSRKVRWWCGDTCPGEMLPTGAAFMTNPAMFEHRCNRCGRYATDRFTYPYIEHVYPRERVPDAERIRP